MQDSRENITTLYCRRVSWRHQERHQSHS